MLQLSMFNFVYYWAIAVVNAFIPLYFIHKGSTPGQVGIILAVGPLVAIFAQPLWGIIADKKQNVKQVILLLLIITFLVSLGLFYSPTYPLILLSMMIFNFFMSPIQPLSDSMASSYAHDHQISYGSIRIWGSLGFASASFLIGWMISKSGLQYLWLIYGFILILTFIIATRLLSAKVKRAPITSKGIIRTVKNPRYLGFLISILFLAIPTRMNDGLLGIHMKQLGASESTIGLAWTVSSLSEIPVIASIYLIMRKVPTLILISISGVLYSVRWFLYSTLQEPIHFVFAQAMHSITFGILMVAAVQYVISVVPREMLATGQTIYFAVYSGLGAIIGNAVGGRIMELYGAKLVYQIGTISAVIGTCICLIMYMKYKNESNQPLVM